MTLLDLARAERGEALDRDNLELARVERGKQLACLILLVTRLHASDDVATVLPCIVWYVSDDVARVFAMCCMICCLDVHVNQVSPTSSPIARILQPHRSFTRVSN